MGIVSTITDYSLRQAKRLVRMPLRQFGFDIRRILKSPPLLNDPLEALHYKRIGEEPSFRCPIDKCITYNGFNHSDKGWHPFSAALKQYQATDNLDYEHSLLEKYYDRWQPENAREALIGCEKGPAYLEELPSYTFLAPWSYVSPSERREMVYSGMCAFYERHGLKPCGDYHGHHTHGPVSTAFGRIEYDRLTDVYDSIATSGYDRSLGGDIVVSAYKRESEYRFGIEHGNHRVAAMSALGYDTIPARYVNVRLRTLNEADCWPQVRRGLWDRDSAIAYFDHLFDFDARAWARKRNLLPEPH